MALLAALVATIVSGTFCHRLFRRWQEGGRRDPALLAWTIALGRCSLASLALLVGVVVMSAGFHRTARPTPRRIPGLVPPPATS